VLGRWLTWSAPLAARRTRAGLRASRHTFGKSEPPLELSLRSEDTSERLPPLREPTSFACGGEVPRPLRCNACMASGSRMTGKCSPGISAWRAPVGVGAGS
jgi:hypothetical protein